MFFRRERKARPQVAMTDEGQGLAIQKGAPQTRKELYERLDELGIETSEQPTFGFRPQVDRSLPVPPVADGAPIVEAARGLRKRRRGQIPLNGTVHHPEARAVLDEIYAQHPKPRKHGATE